MNLATSPQNECENRRRRPSRGLAHTPGTPIFALFRWTSERALRSGAPTEGADKEATPESCKYHIVFSPKYLFGSEPPCAE